MYFVVVSALMLPAVLGNCCFPSQLFGNIYNTNVGHQLTGRIAIDFAAGKYVIRRHSSAVGHLGFTYFDYSGGKQFTMRNSGYCVITRLDPENRIQKCIPSDAAFNGTSYMGTPSFEILSYTYKVGTRWAITSVSKDKCYPVMTATSIGGYLEATFFTSLVDSDQDAVNLLNPDVSNCVEEDESIG